MCTPSSDKAERGINSLSQQFSVILCKKERHPLHRTAHCFSSKISLQLTYTNTLGLMRSLLLAVIPAGQYCEREPILETEIHLQFSFSSLLCSLNQHNATCISTGMWAVHLPKQTSVFYVLGSRIGEEKVRRTEERDKRVNSGNSSNNCIFLLYFAGAVPVFLACVHAPIICYRE